MTPNDAATRLVDAGRSMIAILDEESAALLAAEMERVSGLQERKEEAAARYETTLQEISKTPEVLTNAGAAAQQSLSALKADLETAATRNINALRAALELNRRLVQTIADSVNRQRICAAGYTKSGNASANAPSAASTDTVPISLNQTL